MNGDREERLARLLKWTRLAACALIIGLAAALRMWGIWLRIAT